MKGATRNRFNRRSTARSLIQFILFVSIVHGARGYELQNDPRLPDDLRIKATSIRYVGTTQVDIFDKKYTGSIFSILANVKVETLEGVPDLEVYEVVPAEYEIAVIDDSSKIIHNELIEKIYSTWSAKQLSSIDLYYFYFSLKSNQYALTVIPAIVNQPITYYFFWVNGRVFKVIFKSFKQKAGLGALDAFTFDNLRIRLGDSEVKAYQVPFSIPKAFLALHKQGFFK